MRWLEPRREMTSGRWLALALVGFKRPWITETSKNRLWMSLSTRTWIKTFLMWILLVIWARCKLTPPKRRRWCNDQVLNAISLTRLCLSYRSTCKRTDRSSTKSVQLLSSITKIPICIFRTHCPWTTTYLVNSRFRGHWPSTVWARKSVPTRTFSPVDRAAIYRVARTFKSLNEETSL